MQMVRGTINVKTKTFSYFTSEGRFIQEQQRIAIQNKSTTAEPRYVWRTKTGTLFYSGRGLVGKAVLSKTSPLE